VGVSAFSANFSCPPRSLVIGVPAKVKRQLSDQEVEWKSQGTLEYQELARRCLANLIRTEALTEVEADCGRIEAGKYDFKP